MEQANFIISITHSPHSGNFFINFNTEEKYIVSVKVTEAQAVNIAKDLGLKVMIG